MTDRIPAQSFWTQVDPKYGLLHLAEPGTALPRPEPLLIFVHGILGSCVGTWGHTPALLLQAAAVDLDVVNFRYPAGLAGGDVEQAARDLAQWLKGRFGGYRHLVFVAHSAGGLVVKAMLRNEQANLTSALAEPRPQFRPLEFQSLRTRRVINLDVPHDGASRWRTMLLRLYLWVVGPPLRLLERCVPVLGVRYNRIPGQLVYQNPWARGLERAYVDLMGALDNRRAPRPTSLEILSADDRTIARYGELPAEQSGARSLKIRADVERLEMRGSHFSMKEPARETDLICAVLGRRLRGWAQAPGWALAELTYARIFDFLASVGFRALVGATAPDAGAGGEVERATGRWTGNQHSCYRQLREAISLTSEHPRTYVLTGDAGVGKSIVARVLARDLSLNYLAEDLFVRPLPLLLPLQRVNLSADQVTEFREGAQQGAGWALVARNWCDYVNQFHRVDTRLSHPTVSDAVPSLLKPEWMHGVLASQPVVLILDGVDEFLSKHLRLGLSHFTAMLRSLEQTYQANGRLVMVLGVRSSLPGIESFTRDPRCVIRVRRLSPTEAEQLYPGIQTWLERLPDPELKDLMLTPLILEQLGPRFASLAADSWETRSAMTTAALEVIIGKNQLDSQLDAHGRPLGMAPWLDALMVVAWRYFVGSYGEMSQDDIRTETIATLQRWQARCARPCGAHQPRTPVPGLELAADADRLRVLLHQTIFFPTGPATHRFLHREWEEALAARYLAQCIRHRMADELGDRACTQSMLRSAGEQLGDLTMDAEFTGEFLDRARASGKGYVAGNFATVLANSKIPLESAAVRLLLERHYEVQGVSRYVLLSGLGYRALRFEEPDLCAQLIPAFVKLASREPGGTTMPAIASLAWCYLKKLAPSLVAMPWPGLGQGQWEDEREALEMVFVPSGPHRAVRPEDRSIQRAFIRIQQQILRDPHRPISLVHYLYFLCLAWKHHGAIREVTEEIPSLLAPGSVMERRVEQYALPELLEAYRVCQRLVPPRPSGAVLPADGREAEEIVHD